MVTAAQARLHDVTRDRQAFFAVLKDLFIEHPPLVRVPTLMHSDGHGVLVIEYIPGHPVDAERYPEQPLSQAMQEAVLGATPGTLGV